MKNRSKKKYYNEMKKNLSDLKDTANKNLDNLDRIDNSAQEIRKHVKQINDNTKPTLSKKVVGIISFIITITGISIVTIIQHFSSTPTINPKNTSASDLSAEEPHESNELDEYKIYLTSEYKKLVVYQETLMTVNTELFADSVMLIAESDSGDIYELPMDNKSRYEWVLNVDFFKEGTYQVTAIANISDYEAKAIITVEVSSYADVISPFFDMSTE